MLKRRAARANNPIKTLAADLHGTKRFDYRNRQGRQRFHQWARSTHDSNLVQEFVIIENAADLLCSDMLPDMFLNCPAMQDFIGFVDAEASQDWSVEYDITIADAIFSGFAAQARDERSSESDKNE